MLLHEFAKQAAKVNKLISSEAGGQHK